MASTLSRIVPIVMAFFISAALAADEKAANGGGGKVTKAPATEKPAGKPADKPAGKPDTSRRGSAKPKELSPAATEALKKAMADFHKELETEQPRSTSNYFVDNPNKELTPDVVLALLERRIEQSPQADAYAKWQLLSALPRTLPEEQRPRVIHVLKGAPKLEPLPGLITDPQQRREIENQVRGFGEDDAGQLLKDMEAAQDKVRRKNDVIVAYRDALVQLLPDNLAGVTAAFEDAETRSHSGEAGKSFEGAARYASRWLFTKPPAREVEQLQGLVDELKAAPKTELVVRFRWDQKNGLLRPETQKVGLDAKTVAGLEKDIDKALGGGDQPLDEPKDDGGRGRRRR